MKTMYYYCSTDKDLIARINKAQYSVRLLTPGISLPVAEALAKKFQEFKLKSVKERFSDSEVGRRFFVALDVSVNTIELGLNEAEAVCLLWNLDTAFAKNDDERWFYHAPRLRMGVLTVDGESLVYAPAARKMEEKYKEKLEGRSPNSFEIDAELLFSKEYEEWMTPVAERLVEYRDIAELCGVHMPTRKELDDKIEEQGQTIKEQGETIEKQEETIEEQKGTIEEQKGTIEEQEKEIENLTTEIAKAQAPSLAEALRRYEDCVKIMAANLHISKAKVSRMRLKVPSDFLLDKPELAARCSSGYEILTEKDINELLSMTLYYPLRKHDSGKTKEYQYSLFEDELKEFRDAYLCPLGKNVLMIEKKKIKEFEGKIETYTDMAQVLFGQVTEKMKEKIQKNLKDLFDLVKERIDVDELFLEKSGIKIDFLAEVFEVERKKLEGCEREKFFTFLRDLARENSTRLAFEKPSLNFSKHNFTREDMENDEFQENVAFHVVLHERKRSFMSNDKFKSVYQDDIDKRKKELFDAVNKLKEAMNNPALSSEEKKA